MGDILFFNVDISSSLTWGCASSSALFCLYLHYLPPSSQFIPPSTKCYRREEITMKRAPWENIATGHINKVKKSFIMSAKIEYGEQPLTVQKLQKLQRSRSIQYCCFVSSSDWCEFIKCVLCLCMQTESGRRVYRDYDGNRPALNTFMR